MATNFMGKIGLFTFIRRSRIPKLIVLVYRNADGHIKSGNNLATLHGNLVNLIQSSTLGFTNVVRADPSLISNNSLETNYFRIYWTGLHQIFTKWYRYLVVA